jgi:ATP-dependent Lon protease
MEDVPDKVKKDLKIVFADNLEEVLRVALQRVPVGLKKSLHGKKPYQVPTILAAN